MAELLILGVAAAAFTLTRPSVRERRKLRTIAYVAAETSDSPEAARSAFFRMVDASNAPDQEVNRVDSLPQAHVHSTLPAHQHTNFAQDPMFLVPETSTSQQPGESDANLQHAPSQNGASRTDRSRCPNVPRHVAEAIDKKWATRKDKAIAKYNKRYQKLIEKHGEGNQVVPPGTTTEGKYQKQRGKLDGKHVMVMKHIELKQCTEISLAERKYRAKAEKKQIMKPETEREGVNN